LIIIIPMQIRRVGRGIAEGVALEIEAAGLQGAV
jgi:hypothetical protein